ncbi:hypothetical protein [Acuticoccus kandeliae]|uniref:hypothetical protein n=1 Tax=Acuticoccus kandeliae TaxID=2073160 RepID=UPI0013004AE2|nr:hypothetical protein [Acuticoccus kandeliae]
MPSPRRVGLALALVALAAFATSPAAAHRLKVFASRIGPSIEGEAYFAGSGPAEGVAIALEVEGAVVGTGISGADGRFALPAPDGAVTVVADAQDGHVARFAIAAAGAPSSSVPAEPAVSATPAPGLDAEALETAIARQIAPLAAEIDALESTLRLRDIIGGLGYIVGLFGLVAFLKARRR